MDKKAKREPISTEPIDEKPQPLRRKSSGLAQRKTGVASPTELHPSPTFPPAGPTPAEARSDKPVFIETIHDATEERNDDAREDRRRLNPAANAIWRQDASDFETARLMLPKHPPKSVKEYYKRQEAIIARYVDLIEIQKKEDLPDRVLMETDDGQQESLSTKAVVRGSFVMNTFLFIIKAVAAFRSGSLSVMASLLDSGLDLASGIVLIAVQYLMETLDPDRYPTGKKRFEPLGILVFSCMMFVAAAKVIEEAVYKLLDPNKIDVQLDIFTIAILVTVIVVKAIAHIVCRIYAKESTSAQALAADHRNDVITNTLCTGAVLLAKYLWKFFDPLVAIGCTIYVMYVWGSSAFMQISRLNGCVAPPEYLSALTLLARNHDHRIVGVDTVRAVTSGDGYAVEIDLLLPPQMSLAEAHDIGEQFQMFLERLPGLEVARAYVHLDHETSHNPKQHR